MSTIREKIEKILKQYDSERLTCIGINIYDTGNWYSKAYLSLPIEHSSIEALNHKEVSKIFHAFNRIVCINYLKRVYTEEKKK